MGGFLGEVEEVMAWRVEALGRGAQSQRSISALDLNPEIVLAFSESANLVLSTPPLVKKDV